MVPGGSDIEPEREGIILDVGFNPFRPQRRRSSDYVMLGAAFVVVALLLGWAFLPRG